MATTYKILGQVNTAVDSLTTLYSVPVATSTIISTLAVCNQSNSSATYSVAIRPAGATIDNKHYINFNTAIPANDTVTIKIGITLAATDVISVSASSATMSFMAFGSEIE
jgi:hypothetical protein